MKKINAVGELFIVKENKDTTEDNTGFTIEVAEEFCKGTVISVSIFLGEDGFHEGDEIVYYKNKAKSLGLGYEKDIKVVSVDDVVGVLWNEIKDIKN